MFKLFWILFLVYYTPFAFQTTLLMWTGTLQEEDCPSDYGGLSLKDSEKQLNVFLASMCLPLQDSEVETKTTAALAAVLRRVCTPKAASGKLEVSKEVYLQWKKGGDDRKQLLQVLVQCGGDKDTC